MVDVVEESNSYGGLRSPETQLRILTRRTMCQHGRSWMAGLAELEILRLVIVKVVDNLKLQTKFGR